jgi:cytosine/creatinine deaminase
LDLILRNARADGHGDHEVDVGVTRGRIAAIAPALEARATREIDLAGRFVSPGLVETHVHLDKSCIMERCISAQGTLEEAIAQVAAAKARFTAQDVYARASTTLEKAILQGITHMRTHVEVDPGIGLRGLEGVLPLIADYRWAIDLQICVFPQEGLLNNPGTEALMVESLKRGARVVGAAPYCDSDPRGQIDRVFAMARDFDADIDMHLDFTLDFERGHLDYVCEQARRHRYEGRVTIGHVSTLSAMPAARLEAATKRLAQAGIAVTVLPSTDLFLIGRGIDHNVPRGVAPVHRLTRAGVNCSISTNNVLNPFTPFGDCSLLRMANLYANVAQLGARDAIAECFELITHRPARLLGLEGYGIEVGNSADLVAFDCTDRVAAVAELAVPLYGFKRGRMTFSRAPATLCRP